jgi:hypothetical protein
MSALIEEFLKVFIATIYGEAAGLKPATWRAIASVIINRVGRLEWSRWKTPYDIIKYSGFDAFIHRNRPFLEALRIMETKALMPGTALARLYAEVTPIYNRSAPPTTDAVLYFSPRAQRSLHEKRPDIWPARPRWNFDLLERLYVPGTEGDDIEFYRYINQKPHSIVQTEIATDED